MYSDLVFTPSFTELTSTCVEENMKKLKAAGVKFPFGKFYSFLEFFFLSIPPHHLLTPVSSA